MDYKILWDSLRDVVLFGKFEGKDEILRLMNDLEELEKNPISEEEFGGIVRVLDIKGM